MIIGTCNPKTKNICAVFADNFCVVEMSNFYFDVLKDRLYTSAPQSKTRRAAQTVLYKVLDALTLVLTPILAFTADEIWQSMPHDKSRNGESPLFNEIPQPDFIEADSDFIDKWDRIHAVRFDFQKALELARIGVRTRVRASSTL